MSNMNHAFRKIRPSFGDSSEQTSTPNTSESTTGSSDPRRVGGEKELEASAGPSLKRRRVPESVTRNACLNCKKARAKCDGKKPCKRCEARMENGDCVYEVHIKHAKEELVKQIKELRAKDHLTEQILHALSSDEKVPEILDRLQTGETYESIVEWLGRSPLGDFETLSPRESHQSTYETEDHEMGGTNPTISHWTTVTPEQPVLDHLFMLYFAWVHPVHTLFNEGHFVADYQSKQVDNYCSPVLVNAICAMACHLHSAVDGDEFGHLGEEFSEAVRMTIDDEDSNITTIQAFAVMFLVDCARSNVLRAATYLRVATDRLTSIKWLDSEGFTDVWKTTVCGIRNLNVEWAQATFQVPPVIIATLFEGLEDEEDNDSISKQDAVSWYYYRKVGDEPTSWPCLLATTNREKSKLMGIIHNATTMMYTQQGEKLTANNVLRLYNRFVTWREELPSFIGNVEEIESHHNQALPHAVSLLILYSNAVILLLRPLLDFEGFPSAVVEETIWRTAQEGLFLLDKKYLDKYSCRYQPVLQMFGVLQLTDVICRFFPHSIDEPSKDGAAAIRFGMEVLIQSSPGFPIASPFQEMLRRTASDLSIHLPRNLAEPLAARRLPKQRYRMDDLIDACTRPSYVQPATEIHNRYLPSFSADWVSNCGRYGFHEPAPGRRLRGPSAEERGAQSLMQIHNLLNIN